ncbi:ABC transporter ATP-binding protein [Dethiobacter alkaliphilus]|uniref:ABC transporter related protein n=1 Tax=Dethiobacter alkaliphilus AHT 1 TaxID=555088 RepID=C0GK82_DETAL|nr:ABC transporter ATP-binding protein [Dethiobacter alkaliphilus]EEG76265.1 ABC transporter related protein [Dethiobacter alkaliphilus AHT 1]
MSLQLKIHELTMEYDAHPILDGVNFSIQGGEMIALLGPNGAGKSTLMRCISKALEPSSGTVLFNDREIRSLSSGEIARQLAVVPQDTGVDFDFTVEEVVQMGRFPYQKGWRNAENSDDSLVHSAMETTGILKLRHRSAATLSGGERQRMVFARALCQEPELLLLDEPTANLDIGYQWELLHIALKLNREKGVTIIAAIHDLNLATLFFSQFILLSAGKVLSIGSSEEVLTETNISKSYGVPATIFRHPLHGRLQVSIGKENISPRQQSERYPQKRIHVVGGGSEALPILEALLAAGYSVSVGPVSREDSGYHFARFYDLPVMENPPFSPINEEMYQKHLQLMHEAECVILPPISFGEGNLRNLEAMTEVVGQGVMGIVLESQNSARDFTGGKAATYLQQLQEGGALFFNKEEHAIKHLKMLK